MLPHKWSRRYGVKPEARGPKPDLPAGDACERLPSRGSSSGRLSRRDAEEVTQGLLARGLVTLEPLIVGIFAPLATLLPRNAAGQAGHVEVVDVHGAHEPRELLLGTVHQILEAHRDVAVVLAEDVRELPQEIEQHVRMGRRGRI